MTEQEARLSLQEYAASAKSGCWVCGIPEREEIDAAILAGTLVGVIVHWLVDIRGYARNVATRNKVRNHRDNHVTR
jgi:hypothetical protein